MTTKSVPIYNQIQPTKLRVLQIIGKHQDTAHTICGFQGCIQLLTSSKSGAVS